MPNNCLGEVSRNGGKCPHTRTFARPSSCVALTVSFHPPPELLSPGAESDSITAEGCLDDHEAERGGGLLDDMDEALTSEGGLLLESGPSDLCDPHDPDLDESSRAIRCSQEQPEITEFRGRSALTP